MAKTSKAANKKVSKVMHEFGKGKLKSSSGKKVTDRKQAIAIGLSEAREEGLKVPAASKKKLVKKAVAKKAATGKTPEKSTKPAAKKATKKK